MHHLPAPRSAISRQLRRVLHGLGAAAIAVAFTGVAVVGGPVRATPPHVAGRSQAIDPATLGGPDGRAIDLGLGAELVGFTWSSGTGAVAVRSRTADGWSAWTTVDGDPAEGPDSDSPEYRPTVAAGPVWLGHDVTQVQVRRVAGTLGSLRLEAIDSEPGTTTGTAPAGAALIQPTFITRAAWGADESWRNQAPGCEDYPHYADAVRTAYVHHTATTNAYAPSDSASIMRGIYYFHTHTQGWCDIAYNFLIDRFGQVFEGRYGGITTSVIGGHAAGFNTGSTGISLIGDFDTGTVPAAAYDSLRRLLAWKLAYHGIDPTAMVTVIAGEGSSSRYPPGTPVLVHTILGHRETNYTSCPGGYLDVLLPTLRTDVASWMPAVDPRFAYGNTGDWPLVGDWDGNGTATPGVFRAGWFYLRNTSGTGAADIAFPYGDIGDTPVVGDWDGNGTDTVGVYRRGVWLLRNANATGPPSRTATFGGIGYFPVPGDWNGDGIDTPGATANATWYLSTDFGPLPEIVFAYGAETDWPIAGDWDGNGTTDPGVYRGGRFYLRKSPTSGVADISFAYPGVAGFPLAGDFDGTGPTTTGLSNAGYWYLDRS